MAEKIFIAIFFNVMDIVVGFTAACKNHEVKSSKMRDGLFKKCGFIFVYILGFVVDKYGVYIDISMPFEILTPIIVFTVATELASIIENIGRLNPLLSKTKLMSFFSRREG